MTAFCPECHQPIGAGEVAGVRLTNFKATLFHYIETHPGLDGPSLANRFPPRTRDTIRAHIYQINDALMNTTTKICNDKFTGYYVKKGPRR